jgi:glycosidase
VSVEEQGADPNSLLNFYRRLLSLRRERPELEGGETRVIPTNRPDVLVLLRNSGEHASLLLVNLSDSPTTVALPADSLPAGLASAQLKNLLTSGPEPGSVNGRQVRLPPFGVKLLAR